MTDDGSWLEYVRGIAGAVEESDSERERIIHTKGTTVAGVFHRAGGPGRLCVARFSGTQGGAHGDDAASGDQGVHVRVAGGADGPRLHATFFSRPAFFVRDAQSMREFLEAVNEEKTSTGSMDGFLGRHPEAGFALSTTRAAPRSFADLDYHSVHAYGIRTDHGTTHWRRLELHPVAVPAEDGEHDVTPTDPDYLHDDLRRRERTEFDLVARGPAPGEPDDVTVAWTGAATVLGRFTFDRTIAPLSSGCDLTNTGGMLPPRDRLFADRVELYRAAQRLRSAPPDADYP